MILDPTSDVPWPRINKNNYFLVIRENKTKIVHHFSHRAYLYSLAVDLRILLSTINMTLYLSTV